MVQKHQIAMLLQIANSNLTYSEIIISYPKIAGKRNYDPSEKIDSFYKKTCNVFFNDSLLILSNLLDNKDKRVMSFKNCSEFYNTKKQKIDKLINNFNKSHLQIMRDQILAHQDISNTNNNIPDYRTRGITNPQLIDLLRKFLSIAISEFKDYAKSVKTPYSNQAFDTSNVKKEIALILNQAKPILTDCDVI
jgi:hypothetical protein